jgi:hypothetical protein
MSQKNGGEKGTRKDEQESSLGTGRKPIQPEERYKSEKEEKLG